MNDAQMKHRDLVGKTVFTQDGHELGEIAGLVVDVGSWRVPALDVRLDAHAEKWGAHRLSALPVLSDGSTKPEYQAC